MTVPFHAMRAVLLSAALAPLLLAAASGGAAGRGFVAFNFGLGMPLFGPPAYYYPPPVYYYPPPPPPVVYMPAPAPAVPARAAPQTACHEYQTTAVIDGKTQPIWGRVCQQPDGSWRIAN